MLPYIHSGIFTVTLNTACRRSKQSTKKNILSIAKVVTFEATPEFWGIEYWRKWCKERTFWTKGKALPVGVDVMACCSFSTNFCASSYSCYCSMVENFPPLMIIYSFFSRFCTLYYSSRCRSNARWASLKISTLSSGGIEMAKPAYNYWGELQLFIHLRLKLVITLSYMVFLLPVNLR